MFSPIYIGFVSTSLSLCMGHHKFCFMSGILVVITVISPFNISIPYLIFNNNNKVLNKTDLEQDLYISLNINVQEDHWDAKCINLSFEFKKFVCTWSYAPNLNPILWNWKKVSIVNYYSGFKSRFLKNRHLLASLD